MPRRKSEAAKAQESRHVSAVERPRAASIGDDHHALEEVKSEVAALDIPPDWNIGALLNVRNGGTEYFVTLFPEEYDHQRPERTLRFQNPGTCQNFVSAWYSRTYHDGRAG